MEREKLIPLSALEHYEYCPRQCALIHVDGQWADNRHTVSGTYGHRRIDSGPTRVERGAVVRRSIPLWSDALGLIGRSDAVEFWPDGHIAPIEYKIGTRHGLAADLQLCAQSLCLEEMTGTRIDFGYIWTSVNRRRRRVAIDADLRGMTVGAIQQTRRILMQRMLPKAPSDERCSQCQFLGQCLPDVVSNPSRARTYLKEEVFACGS